LQILERLSDVAKLTAALLFATDTLIKFLQQCNIRNPLLLDAKLIWHRHDRIKIASPRIERDSAITPARINRTAPADNSDRCIVEKGSNSTFIGSPFRNA